jgi:hypothetical protein
MAATIRRIQGLDAVQPARRCRDGDILRVRGSVASMTVAYEVEVVHEVGDARVRDFEEALVSILAEHGLHLALAIVLAAGGEGTDPQLTVFFGSKKAVEDVSLVQAVAEALAAGRLVIPVVGSADAWSAELPSSLHVINGFSWAEGGSSGLARLVLEELGIEDVQRTVFVSHRRIDALQMAEQLHDALTHRRFEPFIDRFDIRVGEPIQRRIADALESYAFLLLVESPEAHTSPWVFYEVEYALSHSMGVLVLTWPGDPAPLPGTVGLPRLQIREDELLEDHGYQILSEAAVDRVLEEIERHHALGIVRRRKNLLGNVVESASHSGAVATVLPRWRIRLDHADGGIELVGVASRLPQPLDLYELDQARDRAPITTLVHAARQLPLDSQELLTWCCAGRQMSLVPANAVGARWL